jgi:hypothetical protein
VDPGKIPSRLCLLPGEHTDDRHRATEQAQEISVQISDSTAKSVQFPSFYMNVYATIDIFIDKHCLLPSCCRDSTVQ